MKTWPFVLMIAAILFAAGLAIHHLGDTSPGHINAHIVAVAVRAMNDNGHSGLLQGNGLNSSPDAPFVSSKDATHAVVTIPYTNNLGPVANPTVNLVLDEKMKDWQAVSFNDGEGHTHAIGWHP